MFETLRNELLNVSGVVPSSHWLEDCCNELRLAEQGNATADAVLQQILHHDLRDVVREFDGTNAAQSAPSFLLRRALHESMTSSSRKARLPENFRLLVQVEELLDVSKNVEARLSVGPASVNGPPIGNQQSRCLKLILSDGFYADGSPFASENSPQAVPPIIAMEVSPIQSLSVNSFAGIKVLLNGPIDVRHGVLMLHPGNAVTLGGKVDELVDLQRKALEQAKRAAGVGADHTIRALVGNVDSTEMQGEDDEAEHESGDVAMPPPAPVWNALAAPPPLFHPPVQQSMPTRQTAATLAAPPAPPMAPVFQHQPPLQQQALQFTSSSSPPPFLQRSNLTPAPAPRPMVATNPYLSSSLSAHTTTTTTSPAPPSHVKSTNNPSNPYARTAATTTASAPALQVSSSSVPDLKELLARARHDRAYYEQALGWTLSTQLRMVGSKLYFNIEKKKKNRKANPEGGKYEYVLSARFSPDSDNDDYLVTCKVASSILEPFFSESPDSMRKLKKSNGAHADDLVREGGRQLQSYLSEMHRFEVSLELSVDELFGSDDDDASIPVLLISKVCD